jgi:hypothetical protein
MARIVHIVRAMSRGEALNADVAEQLGRRLFASERTLFLVTSQSVSGVLLHAIGEQQKKESAPPEGDSGCCG